MIKEKIVEIIQWLTPGVVSVSKAEVGVIHFRVGWFGWHITHTTYYTPLGEIPHPVSYDLALAIIDECRDWVDAMVLINHVEAGDCKECCG